MRNSQCLYNEIPKLVYNLKNVKKQKSLKQFRSYLSYILGEALSINTMQGYAFHKPHGYAGDYEIIDRIYTSWQSPIVYLRKWDEFFHLQKAPQAVRNRKEYLIELINSIAEKKNELQILNIGSGPGRDMLEYFQQNNKSDVTFECVETDLKAIAYANSLCKPYSKDINFIHRNIFRYKPNMKFDLIWSAGLFDYIDDLKFIHLLKMLYAYTKEGGLIVIGNFSTSNPSKDYMEVIGEWFLNHRSKQQLIYLAKKAGIDKSNIQINSEPLGVNLFLHINKA